MEEKSKSRKSEHAFVMNTRQDHVCERRSRNVHETCVHLRPIVGFLIFWDSFFYCEGCCGAAGACRNGGVARGEVDARNWEAGGRLV